MVRLGSSSSSSSSSSRRASRQSASTNGARSRTTNGANSGNSGGIGRSSTGRPRLSIQPTWSFGSSTNQSNSKATANGNGSGSGNGSGNTKSSNSRNDANKGKGKTQQQQEAKAEKEQEVDLHALRRLHRHERTLDIPSTLSIPHVDSTNLDTNTSAVAKTPYGGRMIAGVDGREGMATPGGPGGRMRKADAGHTPGGIYLPAALLPSQHFSATTNYANNATDINFTATPTALPSWDDGISPLAFGAEARPVRTHLEQQVMEDEERRQRRREREQRRDREDRRGAFLEYDDNGGKMEKEKSNREGKGKSKSGSRQKRSDAYEVSPDGLLVIKPTKSSDNGDSSGSGASSKANATKSKSKARANKKKSSKAIVAANLRTLGKAGMKSLRRGGAKSRQATVAAAIVVKTKVEAAIKNGGDDDDDAHTIQRSKSRDGSDNGTTQTPALPAKMARQVDDGAPVAPYSTLRSAATPTRISHTPRRHHRPPVPLHNFRRLSMIDLRDVASEQVIPTTVKRRVAAAKARAIAAGTAGMAASAVSGSAAATLAYEGARIGGTRAMDSARKVGRSATKSMARLRRRIVGNVNAAGYEGQRREFAWHLQHLFV